MTYLIHGCEWWFGFPDLWSGQKPCWYWYLTPVVKFCEVRRAKLVKSTLLTSTRSPGNFSYLIRSAQIRKREWGCGRQREATAHIKFLVKLQPWFLSLRWKTYLRQNCSPGSCACSEGSALGQYTRMIMMRSLKSIGYAVFSCSFYFTFPHR